ncbi:MAG: OmpA family protein [Myxococcales bacterium]|nr:OmpA family protein [Myxococcales bacterium]
MSRARLLVALGAVSLLAAPVAAQPTPDAGVPRIRIRLTPADLGMEDDGDSPGPDEEQPRGRPIRLDDGPPEPPPERGRPVRVDEDLEPPPAPSAPAPVGPPAPPAGPADPAAAPPARVRPRRPKKRRRDWKPLEGTGEAGGRKTKWGVVETVTPREAAQARGTAGGEEIEFARRVRFNHDSITFAADAGEALQEVVDHLQASPEIRLLLIEGHTDQTGTLRYNQKLSEARASAVREALIQRGVAPERLVAYGYGETRPVSHDRAQNRRVLFRLVEGDRRALMRRAASEWGQAAAVGLWGDADWVTTPQTDADHEDDDGAAPAEDSLAWQAVTVKAQFGEGTDLRTGPGAHLLLRLPDLTRVMMQPDTRLRLSKIFYDRAGKTYIALRVRQGAVTVMANPLERGASRTLVSYAGGSVETIAADFALAVSGEGQGRVTVDRGRVQVATGGPASTAVAQGQALALGEAAEPRGRLRAPVIVGPFEGAFPGAPTLTWQPVDEAVRYAVEVAPEVDFFQTVARGLVDTPSYTPDGLGEGATWYWRVRALDAEGVPGMSSRIHAFQTTAPPPPAAPRGEPATAQAAPVEAPAAPP